MLFRSLQTPSFPDPFLHQPGQSLAEYIVTGGVIGLIAMVALVGFNSSFLQSLLGVKSSLSSASAGSTGQTNLAITSAYQAALAAANSAAVASSSQGGAVPVAMTGTTLTLTPEALSQAQNLLSQIDPALLPEVSGGNGTTGTLSLSATTLLNAAAQLETVARSSPNLDVTDLVYKAKTLAAVQFAEAAAALPTSGVRFHTNNQPQINALRTRSLDIAWELLQQNRGANDEAIIITLMTSLREGSSMSLSEIKESAQENYSQSFTPVVVQIQKAQIQTQQAHVVQVNGGNISSRLTAPGAPATSQGVVASTAVSTDRDARAINRCQNATCTP